MKKMTRAIALVLLILLALTAAVFASGENVVVSLEYLNGTYFSKLISGLSGKTEELDAVYDGAVDKLEEKLGGGDVDLCWNTSGSFEFVYPRSGETVTLGAGSGLLWQQGTGAASSVLVDVTTGEELAPSQPLTAGHRYLAEQETVITAMSTSVCGAEGRWRSTATGTAPVELPFRDVSVGDWYYDAVCYAVEKGLFNGTTANTFEPNASMNRAMLATVLYRIEGQPAVTGTNPFADVPDYEWYVSQVIWAYQAGVVNGTGATTFSPMDTVTREQLAVLLYRYSAYRGLDVSAQAAVSGFKDAGSISDYAVDGMSWAVASGILVGSDGKLNPGQGATRAEVATMLQRYQNWATR